MQDDKPGSRTTVRDALIRARSALLACLGDGPEDLGKPERRSVIERRIREITEAIGAADLGDSDPTERMIAAGLAAFWEAADSRLWDWGECSNKLLIAIYRAMEGARAT